MLWVNVDFKQPISDFIVMATLFLMLGCAHSQREALLREPVWRIVVHDGVKLETWTLGDPRSPLAPIVLLPGMTGSAHHLLAWSGLVQALATQRQVIGLSFRGRGGSSSPERGWTPEHHHDDLKAVLDAYGVARAHLVAHSMGVGYALGFAEAHSERVLSVVSGDYAPWLGQVDASWVKWVSARPPPAGYDLAMAERILREQGAPTAIAHIAGDDDISLTRDYRPFLARSSMPVLVLQATKGVVATEAITQWLTVWASARSASIQTVDSDHDVFANPEAQRAVLRFIERQP